MIDPQNVETYRRALDEATDGYARNVLGGTCEGIEEYRSMVGFLAGMREALRIFDEMVSRQNEGHR